MERERWENIKKHYNFLLDLSESAREDYLIKVADKDADLADRLRSMLLADHEDETFLNRPALTKLKEIQEPDFFVGKEIDRYKLMYLIGVGGMGNVYLAERTDLEAHQQVVVKIMNTGYLSNSLRQRFDLERKILSRLNHPHITRIYDGGITEQGLPYIVMEYIDGKPLMEYINDNKLGVDERIELFLDMASAVSYAHQNFIMHCDLKPANILVTNHGIVKVIDFGIAKILDTDDDNLKNQITHTGIIPLTPAYASPEQVTKKPLTIATDIYSLGVVLYEMLTQNKPFPISKNTEYSTVEKWITQRDPLKPSASISPEIEPFANLKTWQKKLRGDLDNIILKTLKKNPQERYSSVEHLIDDINRYKDNYPVVARPNSLKYRFNKYVKRRKVVVAAASILFIVLIGGISSTLWQADRARKERDVAQYEAAKARQIKDFVIDLFENSDPDRRATETMTVESILEKGVENLEDLHDHPKLHSEMLRVVGRLYRLQRLYYPSKETLEKSLEIGLAAYGENHVEPAITKLELASTLHYLSENDRALTYLLEAKPIIEGNFGKISPEYARTVYFLGQFETNKGAYDTALEYLDEAKHVFDNMDVLTDKDLHQLLNIYNGIARVRFMTKDYTNAIAYYHKSLKISDDIEGEVSQNKSINYYNLSNTYFQMEQLDSADIYINKHLETYNILFGDNSDEYSMSGLSLLASIKSEKGEIDEAEKTARQALHASIVTYGEKNFNTAISRYTLGEILIKQNKFKEGEAHILEATSVFEDALGDAHPSLSVVYAANSDNYKAMNNLAKAVSYLRHAIEIHKDYVKDRPLDRAEMKFKLAEYMDEITPNNNEIESLLTESYETYKNEKGVSDSITQKIANQLTKWYQRTNQAEKVMIFQDELNLETTE